MPTGEVKTNTKNNKSKESKNTTVVDKEKENLKEVIRAQELKMKELQDKLDLLVSASINSMPKEKKEKKNIKIINLTTGGFTLRGSRLYHFEKQFDYRLFSENEAKIIVNNMPQSISNGFIYIADSDFVKECELEDIYDSLLNDEQLKNLLNKSYSDVCEIYKNASDHQKKIIIDMIVDKKLNDQKIDANILMELGKLCGKDLLDIEPLNEEE